MYLLVAVVSIGTALILIVSDRPQIVGSSPDQVYLAKGMTGRIDCPFVDANPPVTATVWSKNERVIDAPSPPPAQTPQSPSLVGSAGLTGGSAATARLRVDQRGSLFIKTVQPSDEGRYACTPHSALGAGHTSSPIYVLVRGQLKNYN